MKKLIFAFSVLAIVGALVLYSCQQDNEERGDSLVSNYNGNPYDFVGEYHNKGLKSILENLKQTAKTRTIGSSIILEPPTLDEIKKATMSFCQENILEFNGTKYLIKENDYSLFDNIIQPSTRSLEKGYSSDVQHYLSLFKQNLKNPQDVGSIDDFMQKIKEIEQEIYYSDIKEEDKILLLISYAVGRHSLDFWLEVPKINTRPVVKTRGESFSDWWSNTVTPAIDSIVTADFAGAAAGALTGMVWGGAAGSIVPGAGNVTGAVVGAVTEGAKGALYGSVVGGVLYYLN